MYQSWWPCGVRHMPNDYVGNQQGWNGVAVKPALGYICVFARYSSFKMITRFELSDLTMQTWLFFTVVSSKQTVNPTLRSLMCIWQAEC